MRRVFVLCLMCLLPLQLLAEALNRPLPTQAILTMDQAIMVPAPSASDAIDYHQSCTPSSPDNGADLPSAGTDFSVLVGLSAQHPLFKRAARATPCYVPIVQHVLFLPVIKPPPLV